jgi:hypothetical protein
MRVQDSQKFPRKNFRIAVGDVSGMPPVPILLTDSASPPSQGSKEKMSSFFDRSGRA